MKYAICGCFVFSFEVLFYFKFFLVIQWATRNWGINWIHCKYCTAQKHVFVIAFWHRTPTHNDDAYFQLKMSNSIVWSCGPNQGIHSIYFVRMNALRIECNRDYYVMWMSAEPESTHTLVYLILQILFHISHNDFAHFSLEKYSTDYKMVDCALRYALTLAIDLFEFLISSQW